MNSLEVQVSTIPQFTVAIPMRLDTSVSASWMSGSGSGNASPNLIVYSDGTGGLSAWFEGGTSASAAMGVGSYAYSNSSVRTNGTPRFR